MNKRQYKGNRSYRYGYDDGFDDGFGNGVRKSRKEIDGLKHDLAKEENINNQLRKDIVNEKTIAEKQKVIAEEQKVIAEKRALRCDELEFEVNQQKGRIDGLKERVDKIDADVKVLEEEYTNNLNEIERLGSESDVLEAEIFDIDNDLFNLSDKPFYTDRLRSEFSRMRRERQAEKKAKRKSVESNQRRVNKLIKENEGVNSKINNLKVKSYDLTRNEVRMA